MVDAKEDKKIKKLLFFMPALLFTIFYGGAALGGIGGVHPIVVVWLALFWLAGALLSKTMFWGGILGIIPAAYFIYMGTQQTGQIVSETPFGIAVLLYYMGCMYCVYKNNLAKSHE